MKTRLPLFIVLLALISPSTFADLLAPSEAISLAQQWFNGPYRTHSGDNFSQAKASFIKKGAEGPGYYLVKSSLGAFAVVSAESGVKAPILGYGQDTTSTTEEYISPWMNEYLFSLVERTNPESEFFTRSQSHHAQQAVRPLTTTQWTQNGYYDDWIPNEYLVGCVATAVAQFLRYHAHPSWGEGQYQYHYPSQGTLSVDFSQTYYDWQSMPDQLTQPNQEVAKIMYHAGVAVGTKYGADVSLARMADIPYALQSYFRYGSYGFEYLNQQGMNTAKTSIQSELYANRIVILTGLGDSVGHAWIVDGYDGQGYYHMNWGWGGKMNGYFLLESPTLSNGYDFSRRMAMVRAWPIYQQ